MYMKSLANRHFFKKKLDTNRDTHCIKIGVQFCHGISVWMPTEPGPHKVGRRGGNSLAPSMFDFLGVERPQGAEPKNKTICLWQMVLFLAQRVGFEPT